VRRFITLPLLTTVLVSALVSVLLSGCGGGTDIAAPPSSAPAPVSTSPSPSASPSAVRESAKDFIRRWEAAGDAMQRDGDTAAFTAMSGGCKGCDAIARQVAQVYANGGVIKFAGTRIGWIHKRSDYIYEVREIAGSTRLKESASATWKTLKGGSLTALVTLRPVGQSWLVTDYGQLAGSAS